MRNAYVVVGLKYFANGKKDENTRSQPSLSLYNYDKQRTDAADKKSTSVKFIRLINETSLICKLQTY